MKFSAVVFAALVVPAASMSSYLNNLGASAGISQAPVSFAPAPAAPAVPASKNTADYMSALNSSGSAAPSGAGLGSYLDALKVPASSTYGSGMPSYSAGLGAAPAAPVTPSTPVAPDTPATYSSSSVGGVSAPTTAGYLGALGGATSRVGGAGIRTHVDDIPVAPAARGGAGIPTYKDALASNSVVQGGAGIRSHADALSPYSNAGGQSYGPSGTEYNIPAAATYNSASVDGKFDFSLEASAEIVEQIRAAGDRRVTLSGVINDVRY